MIGYLDGTVIAKDDRGIILLVRGVGYRVSLTPDALLRAEEGAPMSFFIHTAVRDDAIELFGFADRRDLKMFQALMLVSGIGPKSALGTLASAGTEALLRAIRGNDASYLVKTAGVGKKTAEKIVLELRDKDTALPTGHDADAVGIPRETEAIEALEALGYHARDVRELVQRIAKDSPSSQDTIRRALQELGKR